MDGAQAGAFLKSQGVVGDGAVSRILTGFDRSRPMYLQNLWEREELLQFMRNPSFWCLDPARGNWFCLRGGTLDGLAARDGPSGRRLQRFKVIRALQALEGTAGPMREHIAQDIGGRGGQTQLFVAPALYGCLQSMGPAG